jgi:hypothetical protein
LNCSGETSGLKPIPIPIYALGLGDLEAEFSDGLAAVLPTAAIALEAIEALPIGRGKTVSLSRRHWL